MPTYVTKAEVVTFLSDIYSAIAEADISDLMLNQSWSIIENRTELEWDINEAASTIRLNGTGENHIFVPPAYLPITSLTSIIMYKSDETTTTLTLSGDERQVWWDPDTGRIEMVEPDSSLTIFLDEDDVYVVNTFVYGVNNIYVTGIFGSTVPDMVKFLQMLLILKAFTIKDPSHFKVDLMAEKMGKYEYKMGVPSSQAEKNQYKGLDGYIEFLFGIISSQMDLQAI